MIFDRKMNNKILIFAVIMVIAFGANIISNHIRFSQVNARADELAVENQQLTTNLQTVTTNCTTLENNYNTLQQSHNELETNYTNLETNYNTLSTDYNNLETSYNALYDEYVDITETILGYQAIEDPLTKQKGVNMFNGHRETYYNLPMGLVCSNATKKGIEGKYWEREDGAKMFGKYVIVAANWKLHPYGSIVETSLGEGIVLDTGTFIYTYPEGYDLAVTW